ncbi:MAG: carboxymuconolactone decarboxylase family protein [Proteobacteria bacterium]|nr:carboxymuconolactone decarboxylase family protein [Pseudomonadota bacterium]
MNEDRLPPLPESQWSEQQRAEARAVIDGPRGALVSPFVPLLRSPELMGHAQRMGEYLRYRSAIGLRLSELAILVTARHWSQPVEWAIHAPIAAREGIAPEAIAAIAEGRDPAPLRDDEQLVHDFCTELHRAQSISDPTWARAVARWGEQGVIDLIAINGYYALLSMVMNAARTAVPASSAPPLPPLPR